MSFDVNIAVRRGERLIEAAFATGGGITALVGPSGAGKTSILLAIAGLLRPERGTITVGGDRLYDSAHAIDLAPEHRACGFVFQDLRLFPHKSVRSNMIYGQDPAVERAAAVTLDEAVRFLGIAHLLDRRPRTLSGGEAQRVAIGRALLSAPRCLLMDEPLTALDDARREDAMRLIERVRDELRLPVLLVSHHKADVGRLADAVIEMRY